MTPLPTAFVHASPQQTLVPHLKALLPYSVPVLRRLEFHFQSPHAAVISTLDPNGPPPQVTRVDQAIKRTDRELASLPLPPWEESPAATVPAVAAPFAVLYMDRSRHPETESWLFSTADLPSFDSHKEAHATHGHLLAVLNLASSNHGSQGLAAAARQPADPGAMICGSVSRASLRLLYGVDRWDARDPAVEYGWASTATGECSAPGNRSAGGAVRGYTVGWIKYVFPPLAGASTTGHDEHDRGGNDGSGKETATTVVVDAPEGLHWSGPLAAADYDKVVSSTSIPRTARTLALLPCRALRDGDDDDDDATAKSLQAWAFLTPDGSVGALHVQPELRGRGVARTLIRSLRANMATEKARAEWEEGEAEKSSSLVPAFAGIRAGEAWNHSDTAETNAAARRVLSSSGGVPNWFCYWCFVDLDGVAEEVSRYTQVA